MMIVNIISVTLCIYQSICLFIVNVLMLILSSVTSLIVLRKSHVMYTSGSNRKVLVSSYLMLNVGFICENNNPNAHFPQLHNS